MILDSHVHLMSDTRGWYAYKRQSGGSDAQRWDGPRLLALLDEVGIDRCFLFTLAGLYGFSDARRANDEIAEAVAAHTPRFIGFGTVFPHQDREAAARETERAVRELGLRGLKFHPWLQSFPANTSDLWPTLEVCSQYRLPVLFHTGTPPYSQPFQVMSQARRFPAVPMILGHFGKLLGLDAVHAAQACPNLYLETSGGQIADYLYGLERIDPSRILFGTDLPIGGAASARWNLTKLHSLPLTKAQLAGVLGGNAQRLIDVIRL